MTLYHGGMPGLRVGELVERGHERAGRDDCPICRARKAGDPASLEPLTAHPEHVYASTSRLYAKFYASLYGLGDLYRVAPVGEAVRSDEDLIEAWRAPALRVEAILDRAVRLTDAERRRLLREWPQQGNMLDLAIGRRGSLDPIRAAAQRVIGSRR